MITEIEKRFVVADDCYVQVFRGLSTDTKPTGCLNGSEYTEMDTGTTYKYDGENAQWIAQ